MSNVTTLDAAVNAVRYAVKAQGTWSNYVTEHNVTKETVKAHADTLAALAFPNEETVQARDGKRTKYGNAVQAAKAGLNYALGKSDPDENAAKALLTSEGKKSSLDAVIAAWHASQK